MRTRTIGQWRVRGRQARLACLLAALISSLVSGCLDGGAPVVNIWAKNESPRAYLLRVTFGSYHARVYHLLPGESGWAVGADAPTAVQAEMLDLDCKPLASVDVPTSGVTSLTLRDDLTIGQARSGDQHDPMAELRHLVQVCGSSFTCPVVSPWPEEVPLPSEPCTGAVRRSRWLM